ncbi:MAG: glycoside hydrolase family 20 zincin-like fold domain-containing protein, partial [Bacteroidales bacterium]
MKKLLVGAMALTASVMTFSCKDNAQTRSYNEGINVIPVPLELTVTDSLSHFVLNKNTKLIVSSPDLMQPAAFLAAKLKLSTGFDLKIEEGEASNAIKLHLNTRVPVGHEGYLLKSDKDGVTIEARTPQGAFYGVQTLLQLLPAEIESKKLVKNMDWTRPFVEVKDEPAFRYRGLMLD